MSLNAKLTRQDGSAFENPTLYHSIIGALQYLCNTRPGISFVVNKLSQFLSNPLDIHWIACKRILRYLKGTLNLGLFFRSSTSPLALNSFTDADWASSLDDQKSTTGGVFLRGNLVFWSAKKQSTVARSITEAKYRALAYVLTELVWLKSLLSELSFTSPNKQVLLCDNNSARLVAQNPIFHS